MIHEMAWSIEERGIFLWDQLSEINSMNLELVCKLVLLTEYKKLCSLVVSAPGKGFAIINMPHLFFWFTMYNYNYVSV